MEIGATGTLLIEYQASFGSNGASVEVAGAREASISNNKAENAVTTRPVEEQANSSATNPEGQSLATGGDIRSITSTVQEPTSEQTENRNGGQGMEPAPDSAPVETETESESTTESGGLTEAEESQIQELEARDLEVRQHEQAHLAAAGSLAQGGIQYTYQSGPDGKQYAIGGHVSLDTSSESTPAATISKAKQIQRAAMAPADPSSQDVKVAAQANQMLLDAQRELASADSEGSGSSVNAEGIVPPEDEAQSAPDNPIHAAAVEAYNFAGSGQLEQSHAY